MILLTLAGFPYPNKIMAIRTKAAPCRLGYPQNERALRFETRGLDIFLVETGECRTPRPEEPAQSIYKLSRLFVLAPLLVCRPISTEPVDVS